MAKSDSMFPRETVERLARTLEGVPILGVLPGSPAALAGIRYGDIVLEVNGQRVTNLVEYMEAKSSRDSGMDVLVFRSGEERTERLTYDPAREPMSSAEVLQQLIEARIVKGDADPTPNKTPAS